MKIPKGQKLWETIGDAKGRVKWAITSDPVRIKYYLYKIDGDKAVKMKTGASPAEFAEEIGMPV